MTDTTPPADFVTRRSVYLVVDPRGGPVQSFLRERAYEYARNTGGLVTVLPVYVDNPEDAR